MTASPDAPALVETLQDRLRAWGENEPHPDYFNRDVLTGVLLDCGEASVALAAQAAEITRLRAHYERDLEHRNDLMDRVVALKTRASAAERRAEGLLIAFHDAIRRPMGVTPDSGLEFFSDRLSDEAEDRRPRYGSEAEIAERPENRLRAERDAATARADAMASAPKIKFHQHDWLPGFAAFAPGATTPGPDSRAFCVLNLGSLLACIQAGALPKADLPYVIAESMMHEVIHVLEQWAGVEFSEQRIDALLERYAADRAALSDKGGTDGGR